MRLLIDEKVSDKDKFIKEVNFLNFLEDEKRRINRRKKNELF